MKNNEAMIITVVQDGSKGWGYSRPITLPKTVKPDDFRMGYVK